MLNKAVGETPLSCAEAYRAEHPELAGVSMAYAGRLDPMASGQLMVLLGEECKNQTAYHALDKEYEFSVLLGVGSDSHDVLGRLTADHVTHSGSQRHAAGGFGWGDAGADESSELRGQLQTICTDLTGNIELPYPHFSAKTVQGKPLHMWTLEGRLNEIEIPTKTSTVYALQLDSIETKTKTEVCAEARAKIDTIPEVTEASKALGNDFRRVDVRKDWEAILNNEALPEQYQIAHFTCLASSGTYMRTLAHLIGQRLNPSTPSLAWRIHRTKIGTFDEASQNWLQQF